MAGRMPCCRASSKRCTKTSRCTQMSSAPRLTGRSALAMGPTPFNELPQVVPDHRLDEPVPVILDSLGLRGRLDAVELTFVMVIAPGKSCGHRDTGRSRPT